MDDLRTKRLLIRAFVMEDTMFRDQYFKQTTDNFDDLIVPDEDPEDGGHGDDSM